MFPAPIIPIFIFLLPSKAPTTFGNDFFCSRLAVPEESANCFFVGTPILERSDRLDNFLCGQDGCGVVRNIDIESRVHLYLWIVCRRVSYHRDLVAEFKRITYSCFHTRVCD